MSFLLYRAEQAKKIMILLINYTLKAFIKIVSDSNYVKPCATVNYIITRIKNHRPNRTENNKNFTAQITEYIAKKA